MPRLRALNLYGCGNLEVIYLWQTQVTEQGVAALQNALGQQVEINFGRMTDTGANL